MEPETEQDAETTRHEMQSFVAWAYWAVGGLCFYWETKVFATVNRPPSRVELPIIGECSSAEALIYTLTFFWPALLALHFLVITHQKTARRTSFTALFPGVLADKQIPSQLAYLRILLFFVLVAWPTSLHIFHTFRTFDHMKIVLNSGGKVFPGSEMEKEGILKWKWKKPANGEWRWLHYRDEINTINMQGKKEVTARVWVTAVPIVQPWLFALSSLVFFAALVFELARFIPFDKKSNPSPEKND